MPEEPLLPDPETAAGAAPEGSAAEVPAPEVPAAEVPAPEVPAPEVPGQHSTGQHSTREVVSKARARRQAVLHGQPSRRGNHGQQWIFVVLVLAIALAWLFGRDACTRSISGTYDTLAKDQAPMAGAPAAPGADARPSTMDAEPDDGW